MYENSEKSKQQHKTLSDEKTKLEAEFLQAENKAIKIETELQGYIEKLKIYESLSKEALKIDEMQKNKLQYENELHKILSEKEEEAAKMSEKMADTEQEKREKVEKLSTEIEALRKEKSESQTEYFDLKNQFDSKSGMKTELWKKLSAAKGKASATSIQEEITAFENTIKESGKQKAQCEQDLEKAKHERQEFDKEQAEYVNSTQILQKARELQHNFKFLCEMKEKSNINMSQMNDFDILEKQKEQEKRILADKVGELNAKLKAFEPLLGDKNMLESQINMNLSRLEIRDKVAVVKMKFELTEKEKNALAEQLEGKKNIQNTINLMTSKYHQTLGEIKNLRTTIEQNERELKSDQYKNIDKEIQFLEFQMLAVEKIAVAIDKRHDAIEEGIMLYHSKKMEQINKAIKDLWKLTYKSKDIDTIEIKSDMEKINARSHSFNYRIVFKTPEYF